MLSPPYWIFAENFPKAGRIGKSFLVLLGCPSGRYYLGTTEDQGPGNMIPIDHFHYDVTHAKVSGSCSKDRAQGRSIAGKFKIIHKNTCNAMAAELVHRITSIISIFERTSSDISDKPAFTHQNTSRDNIVKVRKLYFAIFSTFF